VRYSAAGVTYERESLCSNPHGVLIVRFTADKPGVYSPRISFKVAHQAAPTAAGATITCAGALDNGLAYETQCRVLQHGGTLSADGGAIRLAGADAFTLVITGGTSYRQRRQRDRRQRDRSSISGRVIYFMPRSAEWRNRLRFDPFRQPGGAAPVRQRDDRTKGPTDKGTGHLLAAACPVDH